jgi:hypothetical protein
VPDADGNVKGIAVPALPWKEQAEQDLRNIAGDPSYLPRYRDELATQAHMLKAWKAENKRTSGCYWPD